MPRRLLLALPLALLAVLVLASTSLAAPTKRSFKAAHEKRGVATFKLKRVRPERIRSAYVRISKRRKRISLPRMRRAARRGVLRVRVRRVRRRAARRGPRAAVRRRFGTRRVRIRKKPPKLVVVEDSSTGTPSTGQAGPTPTGLCESSAFGSFGVGNWPDGCWRPYADSSPFNQRLPESPRLASNSSAVVQRLAGWGGPSDLSAGVADTTSDWQHPTYYPKPTDPVFTLHCTQASWGTCDIEGHRIRIPQQARAAGGADAHMTVIDQATGWEYDLYKYCYQGCASQSQRTLPQGGGDIYFRWGDRTRIDGDGRGTGDSGASANAGHYGNLAGAIRAQEMERGEINHALFMLVKCDSGQVHYPAGGHGAKCSDPANAPAMGARFQLAMSDSQIDALAVPRWKKTILRAMAHYGMYVGDTGGSPWDLQFESGSTYTSFGYADRMVAFAQQAGIPRSSSGRYYFDLSSGVDWQRHLRVVDPCVAQRTC